MLSNEHYSRNLGRKRSRSPNHTLHSEQRRHRSRSHPTRHQHSDHRRRDLFTASLPFNARPLSKHDLDGFRAVFGLYLDIQKHLTIEHLNQEEVKGRWKSFVRKWNCGELAEGWYDPKTFGKATSTSSHSKPLTSHHLPASTNQEDDDSDDTYGPALPSAHLGSGPQSDGLHTQGPSHAGVQDLQAKQETEAEQAEQAERVRRQDWETLRFERRADRRLQKERLDEIVPRAEAGTRERQLEKRREKADSNRMFATSAHDNADVEVPESDVMGGGDGIDELKRMKQAGERKRSEREVRREEQLAARRAEREFRVQAIKEKEEETMSVLKELARARFGGGP